VNDSDRSPAEWREDDLRTALSTWLTMALDINSPRVTTADLLALRDWIDVGCAGALPVPGEGEATLADRTSMSIRVYWETREWSAARFRNALVEERLR